MRLSELRTHDEVLAAQLRDPAFRAEWERTALARAVALRLVGYRAEHRLAQAELARQLGMRRSTVTRLEAGDHNPSLEMLAALSRKLGIEFLVNVAPAEKHHRLVGKEAERAEVVEQLTTSEGNHILIAAS